MGVSVVAYLNLAVWVVLCGAACGERADVNFVVRVPDAGELNPLNGAVTDYVLKQSDGTVVAVVSQPASAPLPDGGVATSTPLAFGALPLTTAPSDFTLDIRSGNELLGRALMRGVMFKAGERATYYADVRKPLLFVGSATAPETSEVRHAAPEVRDPNSEAPLTPWDELKEMTAGVGTADGRFLLIGHKNMLTVFDTGSGKAIGDAALPFTPSLLTIDADSKHVAAIDFGLAGNPRVALFLDLPSLTSSPPQTTAAVFSLQPALRGAVFSKSGDRLFLLTGGTTEPCAPTAKPAHNSVIAMTLDGNTDTVWTLPVFVPALTVDVQSGLVIVSDETNGQLDTFAEPDFSATVHLDKLYGPLRCPSALHVSRGSVYVVSSQPDDQFLDSVILAKVELDSKKATPISFQTPFYNIPIDASLMASNPAASLTLQPDSLTAYELAISADTTRALFATRTRYHQLNHPFQIIGNDCAVSAEIVEYGTCLLDLRGTGGCAYQLRSQIVISPPPLKECVRCPMLGGFVPFYCPSEPSDPRRVFDRPAGLTALFGGP